MPPFCSVVENGIGVQPCVVPVGCFGWSTPSSFPDFGWKYSWPCGGECQPQDSAADSRRYLSWSFCCGKCMLVRICENYIVVMVLWSLSDCSYMTIHGNIYIYNLIYIYIHTVYIYIHIYVYIHIKFVKCTLHSCSGACQEKEEEDLEALKKKLGDLKATEW